MTCPGKNHSSPGTPICPVFGLVSRICPDTDKLRYFTVRILILTCFLSDFLYIMCNVKVKDLGIDDIILMLQQNRLRWYGHVLRKEVTDWVKKCIEYEVEGSRPRGRPKWTWKRLSSMQFEQGGRYGSW